VDDLSLLVLDQALRERFVALYEGSIPLVDGHGKHESLEAAGFEAVYEALNRGGSHAKGWKLELRNEEQMVFKGSFPNLLTWARKEGLLRGRRNRQLESVIRRNAESSGASVELPSGVPGRVSPLHP
jgi:hypothetical protein